MDVELWMVKQTGVISPKSYLAVRAEKQKSDHSQRHYVGGSSVFLGRTRTGTGNGKGKPSLTLHVSS